MITVERLKEVLTYNPETGDFIRNYSVKGHGIDEVVGSRKEDGHVVICIDYQMYKAHRLAWLYMTGEWPKDDVDHKDRNRGNNRWINLREATRSQNMANKIQEPGASGIVGVHKHGRGWRAKIKVKGKVTYLGTFDTIAEAETAYKQARIIHFGTYNPT